MKKVFYIAVPLLALLVSCHRSGRIKVRNEVSKTVMQNVYWGDIYLGGSLYPGEETEFLKVRTAHEKLPASHRVRFTVEGNGNSMTYSTWGVYELEEGGELKIVLTDSVRYTVEQN